MESENAVQAESTKSKDCVQQMHKLTEIQELLQLQLEETNCRSNALEKQVRLFGLYMNSYTVHLFVIIQICKSILLLFAFFFMNMKNERINLVKCNAMLKSNYKRLA